MTNTIDKLFEKTKIYAFLYKQAALLGTLLAKLQFTWDASVETACVSHDELRWNPNWFMELTDNARVAVLLHELWHLARLHNIRRGTRDPKVWNIACDFRINNDLYMDGYKFSDAGGLVDPELDKPSRRTEEEIYDYLMQNHIDCDMKPGTDIIYSMPGSKEEQESIQKVAAANDYAKSCGASSNAEVTELLNKYLKPKVPWRRLLRQYFLDIVKEDYSWKRPNRRFQDMYLPSMADREQLTALNYYIDTSGSISMNMLERFNAELKSIWQDLKPKILRVVSFDTKIQSVKEITPDKPFNCFKFIGRGGTSLEPVMEHIRTTKPTAAIIFSDLCCRMPKSLPKTPIIWIVVNNDKAMPKGKVVHINEEQ